MTLANFFSNTDLDPLVTWPTPVEVRNSCNVEVVNNSFASAFNDPSVFFNRNSRSISFKNTLSCGHPETPSDLEVTSEGNREALACDVYVDPATHDLHLSEVGSILVDQGVQIIRRTSDIDGEPIINLPDVGADER